MSLAKVYRSTNPITTTIRGVDGNFYRLVLSAGDVFYDGDGYVRYFAYRNVSGQVVRLVLLPSNIVVAAAQQYTVDLINLLADDPVAKIAAGQMYADQDFITKAMIKIALGLSHAYVPDLIDDLVITAFDCSYYEVSSGQIMFDQPIRLE